MTKTSFCGIFATLFVTTTMVLLASCSQDDDNYDSDMYTLAEMGTRLGGGGDPGSGGPAPVITHVDSIYIFEEMCFYPNSVFNSSDFQHSPLVAVNPSLYGTSYIEADVEAILQRISDETSPEYGEPTVTSFLSSSKVMVFYPTPPTYVYDSNFGYIPAAEPGRITSGFMSISLSSTEFEVTSVYLQPDETVLPHRYTLYATGVYHKTDGGTVPCTAFIPNHIYN